jgi:hypothetical protein
MLLLKVVAAGRKSQVYKFSTPVKSSYYHRKQQALCDLADKKYRKALKAFSQLYKSPGHQEPDTILYMAVCRFYLADLAEQQRAYNVLHDFFNRDDINSGSIKNLEALDPFALYYLALSLRLDHGIPQYLVQDARFIPPYLSTTDLARVLEKTLEDHSSAVRFAFFDNVIDRDFKRLQQQVERTGKIDWHLFLTDVPDVSGGYTVKVSKQAAVKANIYYFLALIYRALQYCQDKNIYIPGTSNTIPIFLEAEDKKYGNANPRELFLRAAQDALICADTEKKKYHVLYKLIGDEYMDRTDYESAIDNYNKFIRYSSAKEEKEHLKEKINKLNKLADLGLTIVQPL